MSMNYYYYSKKHFYFNGCDFVTKICEISNVCEKEKKKIVPTDKLFSQKSMKYQMSMRKRNCEVFRVGPIVNLSIHAFKINVQNFKICKFQTRISSPLPNNFIFLFTKVLNMY